MSLIKTGWLVAFFLISLAAAGQADTITPRLIDTAEALMEEGRYDQSLVYWRRAERAYELEEETNLERAHLLNRIGICYFYLQRADTSLVVLHSAFDQLNLKDSTEVDKAISILNNISAVSGTLGDQRAEVRYAKQMLGLILAYFPNAEGKDIGDRYLRVGEAYNHVYEPDSAIAFLRRALVEYRSMDDGPERDGLVGRTLSRLGMTFSQRGDYATAADTMALALKTLEASQGALDREAIRARQNLAAVYGRLGQQAKAIAMLKKNINLLEEEKGYQLFISKAYTSLGGLYLDQGDSRQALAVLQDALRVIGDLQPDKWLLGHIYNSLGVSYSNLGDGERSIRAFERALSLREEHLPTDHPDIYNTLSNLGSQYSRSRIYDRSISYSLRAIAAMKDKLEASHPDLIRVRSNYAADLIKTKRLTSAKRELEELLTVTRQQLANQPMLHIRALDYYGSPALWKGQLDSALFYTNQAIALHEQTLSYRSVTYGRLMRSLGDLAILRGDTTAFNTAERAFKTVHGVEHTANWARMAAPLEYISWQFRRTKFRLRSYLEAPSEAKFRAVQALIDEGKAGSRFFRSSGQSGQNTLFTERMINEIAATAYFEKARITGEVADVFESLIFADRCQSRLMTAALRKSELTDGLAIPTVLSLAEDSLKRQKTSLLNLSNKLRRGEIGRPDSVQQLLFDGWESYFAAEQRWRERLKEQVPRYYEFRFTEPNWARPQVQRELLGPDKALLSYLVRDSSLYTYLLRSDTLIVHEQELVKGELDTLVHRFVGEGIVGYYGVPASERSKALRERSVEVFTADAQRLYELLLAPLADELPAQLTIIPDGSLAYLPFAALISGPPRRGGKGKWAAYPFVLNEHTIDYGFSISQQLRMAAARPSAGAWVGFAPFAATDQALVPAGNRGRWLAASPPTLDPLPASEREVTNIATMTGGRVYLRQQASRSHFIAEADKAGRLHLATHGIADDRHPQDAFVALAGADSSSYDPLRAGEIYGLAIPADLVVLSACESSVGQALRGEGPQSLERAFAYAGARSLLSALWPVNDARTSDLMIAFYRAEQQGSGRPQALRKAMQSVYISDTKPVAHPFFWAGWVLRGGDKAGRTP